MTSTSEKITPDMTIEAIFSKFPHKAQKLAHALTKAGLNCVGCSAATWETLESGILRHGMTEDALKQLLAALNAILEEEATLDAITLTEHAAETFKKIAKTENKEGCALRFDEKPAGCSGFEHELGFSEKLQEDDIVFTSYGVDIHVSKHNLKNLLGSEIDYVDGLQAGFKISNPNVRSSCSCGNSYGY